MSISVDVARELMDFGARLRRADGRGGEPPQAEAQLRGAVAIHNILKREGVAYLADEVGMGKTYVALGVIALFRHFKPDFRVAVIAPRENIQSKWMKEWFNFSSHIAKIPDLRIKALHGGPARPLVKCESLQHFVRETTVDADRDFFLRMSSFSLGAGSEEDDLAKLRAKFIREVPWIAGSIESLRSKRAFKDSLAKAVCCALPRFDLLIVDEAHNLKHGFAENIAARNRCLAFAFGGRPMDEVDLDLFPDYGPRAARVLFLSATPLENEHRQLWNQLDIFGRGAAYEGLKDSKASEEARRELARRFLVRRVTSLSVGGKTLTKNLYRREWRRGGLAEHDTPIQVDDVRPRLVVALVQKKVSELLNGGKFGASFQMGMLASFESFLETLRGKQVAASTTFDDVEQTEDDREREGIDVDIINRLAVDYRDRFKQELPHPKMDALVARLSESWKTGTKALVFLRRVASVWEVKERLDIAYNAWLLGRMNEAFVGRNLLERELNTIVEAYSTARASNRAKRLAVRMGAASLPGAEQDRGGDDTFFAWFFRGDGPGGGWLSGAAFSRRFGQSRYELSTFFEDNYAADLLGVPPAQTLERLASELGLEPELAERELTARAAQYLTQAKKVGRRDRFEAVQAAAMELLAERGRSESIRARADIVLRRRFEFRRQAQRSLANINADVLKYETLFSELRNPAWVALRAAIWPQSIATDANAAFREQELRREVLASAARLGHSLVDLYALAMQARGTLETSGEEDPDEDTALGTRSQSMGKAYIDAVLELLDRQRVQPVETRGWSAYDELSAISENFELILDVNEPSLGSRDLAEVGRMLGTMLGQQQPVGGMTGQVNKTLVRQFRMPGYPFVLLSTDLLQEGEDLHTFCSEVHHYGLAWTPSAVEQRIGRVDRVRSKTERASLQCGDDFPADQRLQVLYPHLEDTIERLQVRRVLRRMDEFIRLMHDGLSPALQQSSRLNVAAEMIAAQDVPAPITTPLTTSFPVRDEDLKGKRPHLAVTLEQSAEIGRRLSALQGIRVCEEGTIEWQPPLDAHSLSGTLRLQASGRRQHFVLHLKSFDEHLVIRCVSPVGRLDPPSLLEDVKRLSRRIPQQLGIIEEADDRAPELTVEEEVLLGPREADMSRASWLIRRVVAAADALEHQLWSNADREYDEVQEQLEREGRVRHAERAQ